MLFIVIVCVYVGTIVDMYTSLTYTYLCTDSLGVLGSKQALLLHTIFNSERKFKKFINKFPFIQIYHKYATSYAKMYQFISFKK